MTYGREGVHMDTSEFDEKIGKLEDEMKTLREQMEKTCIEFLDATKEFVSDSIKAKVENGLMSNSEIAKSLGKEGLRGLRSECQSLITNVPELVNQNLNINEFWGHRGKIPEDREKRSWRYRMHRQLGPLDGPLDAGIRIILGYAGELLEKYQLIHIGSRGSIEWERKSGSIVRYAIGYNWSEKMTMLIKTYSDQYDQLIKLDDDLRKMKDEKSRAEVKNLWDQV